jgi:arylsulfatase A-like enzyme
MKGNRFYHLILVYGTLAFLLGTGAAAAEEDGKIVHDAEHYILLQQHGEKWAAEDKELDEKLKALREKYGKPPNIVNILFDDTSTGEVGSALANKIRGYDTPNMNRMADEGMTFARMYTEPSCTPSRNSVQTGRHPVRTGMYKVGFPVDAYGLGSDEVTIAEVLSLAGYATGFFGKWHLGDIEQSYATNQGFDEAMFSLANQGPPSFFNEEGEKAGFTWGYTKGAWDKKYAIDQQFRPYGWINYVEGKKGGKVREWEDNSVESYRKSKATIKDRTIDFIRRHAKSDQPFYVAYWPMIPFDFSSVGQDLTTSAQTTWAQNMELLDSYIGEIMEELKKQGITENTLVVCMADNGPMKEAEGFGAEYIFRGGKGQELEGGIRVAAFAQWPGVIKADSTVGDIIHEVDLYTTFARLGGAMNHIPTDRIIDGIDQTSLLLNGDGYSRRDYVHVYTGNVLAASIKQQFKRSWVGDRPGLVGNAFYDLYRDPREKFPAMMQMLWAWPNFDHMRARHEAGFKKYPKKEAPRDVPFTGIESISEETKQLQEYVRQAHIAAGHIKE